MDCDLIIKGGTVLPMAPGSAPIVDGAVAIAGDAIVDLGSAADVGHRFTARTTLDAGGGIIMPGLINTHTHLAMTVLRGFADDLALATWLQKHIWPAERAIMNAETVTLGTLIAAAESLQAGVTCVCDMYFHAEHVIAALTRAGLRAVVPESLIDFPTPSCPTPEVALERQRAILGAYRDHPLIVPAVAPHAPYSVGAANLVKEAELSDEFGAPLIIHVAETRWEVEKIQSEKGLTPVAYLAELGILSERTVAAHCVHVSEGDLDTLAEFDVGVASNPVSNLKLASGIAPVPQMLERGIKVSIGTDGAASNNTLDLLRDGQLAALLYKGVSGDPAILPARTLVELLTLGGARVLGLADRIGSLEIGKKADVVCFGVDAPHAFPFFDPYAHVAYALRAADARHVVVNGRVVVEDGRLLTLEAADLREGAMAVAARADEARARAAETPS